MNLIKPKSYYLLLIFCVCFRCTPKSIAISPVVQKAETIRGDTVRTFYFIKEFQENVLSLNDRIYWFKNNNLYSTVGGYNGALLHGDYTIMISDSYLFEKGRFEYGVKEGFWVSWYPNGNILSKEQWKHGELQGDFSRYYEDGSIKQTGTFKDNEYHGRIIFYTIHGEESKIQYRKGKMVERNPKDKKEANDLKDEK
jgi:antitoxin component YwqK of YwqJK toxin-antitoxin module